MESALPESSTAAPGLATHGAESHERKRYQHFWWLIGAGWLFTILAYSIYDQPLRYLLKEQLHFAPVQMAAFLAIGRFTNYIKPIAGVFTDAVPIFGTRRRHYLLISLALCGLLWLFFGIVPRTPAVFLATYALLYFSIVFISTTLGGVMAEGGERFRATGRLSAQRVGIFRVAALIGGPIGGWLTTRDFRLTVSIGAALHFILIPFFHSRFHEAPQALTDFGALHNAKRQMVGLFRCRTLWSAAGLVVLIMAAPGFGTPLYYHQTDTLRFSQQFIANLKFVEGACGVLGALLFGVVCRRASLRPMLAVSILTHTFATLLYLKYKSPISAIVVTGLYNGAQTVSVLPLYDLAMRATPKGSEAMGYSVMMSVWNLTIALSDVLGSRLFGTHVSFSGLIWINALTTALVLIAVPLLPHALTDRKEGDWLRAS